MTARQSPPKPFRFDDHLALDGRRFSDSRLLVFHGASGSGKSTCIDYLINRHADFAGTPVSRIVGGPISWKDTGPVEISLVVVDELLSFADLPPLIRLLRKGHIVIAASHLPPAATRCLGTVWPMQQFATDRDQSKIERYLAALGCSYSARAVTGFCRTFGANYTDADIILEYGGTRDFDRAYDLFSRQCRIERVT